MNLKLKFSFLLSIISIISIIIINYQIAKEYLNSNRKTRALFGITELLQFGFEYYVALLGIASLLLAIIARSVILKSKLTAIAVALVAIALVFLRIWRVFVCMYL